MPGNFVRILAVALVTIATTGSALRTAEASHYTDWVHVRMPFWEGRVGNSSSTYPSGHLPKYTSESQMADWAADIYQSAGTSGAFKTFSSIGSSTLGVVKHEPRTSCTGSTWAGWLYFFNVYDTTYRGRYVAAHVSDYSPITGEGPYLLSINEQMTQNKHIGWTKQWAYSSCYQVTVPTGVHWHVEEGWQPADQPVGQPSHRACYVNWGIGATLSGSQSMGAVGSNATTKPQAC